jgi:hypothetical protein
MSVRASATTRPPGMPPFQAGPGSIPTQPGPAASPVYDSLESDRTRLMAERERALKMQEEALKPADMSKMEKFAQQRGEAGNQGLVMALLARQAGKNFDPLQQHFMQQSAAAHEPMKMTGGTLTDQGFVEDPAYAQNLAYQRADARLKALDTALQGNLTLQSRADLERQREIAAKERTDAQIEGRYETRQLAAAIAGGGANAGVNTLVGTDPDTGAQVFHNNRTNARTTYDQRGNLVPYQKPEVVATGQKSGKGTTDPQVTLDLLGDIAKVLPKATHSGFGEHLDKALQYVGRDTEGANAAQALEPMVGRLISAMPRMEGPQSDKDVELYKRMAGDLANRGLPIPTRQAALKSLQDLTLKYRSGQFMKPNATQGTVPVEHSASQGGGGGGLPAGWSVQTR